MIDTSSRKCHNPFEILKIEEDVDIQTIKSEK